MSLLKSNSSFFSIIPKARTAKIVRNILNIVSTIPDSLDIQVSLCKDVVEWCVVEKRTFLRQRIEAKLANLLLQQKQPTVALTLIDSLLFELKKLDDKQMLTEVHLTESRIYHVLQNIPKCKSSQYFCNLHLNLNNCNTAKASLTASRTAANAIYVVPVLQAEIDEMSGILHCEESDYTTAYSYFLEV
jgi:26S proteasome regulatory subunit N6